MQSISLQNLNLFQADSKFEQQVSSFYHEWMSDKSYFEFQTSGSTGTPKTIRISREQMVNSAQLTIDWLKLVPGDHALLCLPPTYIAGAMLCVRAILADMNLVLIEPSEQLEQSLNSTEYSFQLASFVPNQWKYLLNYPNLLNRIFGHAKGVLIGGARLDEFTIHQTHKNVHFPVYLTYGMTETVSHIAFQSISPQLEACLTLLPGNTIRTSAEGCLIAKGPSTLFEEVVTKDLIELLNPNQFRFIARVDRMINSAGLKINPTEIEQIAHSFFAKTSRNPSLFAIGLPDPFYGEKVVLVIEGSFEQDEFELNAQLNSLLPKNKCPKAYYFLPEFIKNQGGKIDQLKTVTLFKN